jgi:hypothetical protein
MLVTGLGVTEEERMEDLRAHQVRSCEKTKEYLMNYSACCYRESPQCPLNMAVHRPCGRVHAQASKGRWL